MVSMVSNTVVQEDFSQLDKFLSSTLALEKVERNYQVVSISVSVSYCCVIVIAISSVSIIISTVCHEDFYQFDKYVSYIMTLVKAVCLFVGCLMSQ